MLVLRQLLFSLLLVRMAVTLLLSIIFGYSTLQPLSQQPSWLRYMHTESNLYPSSSKSNRLSDSSEAMLTQPLLSDYKKIRRL